MKKIIVFFFTVLVLFMATGCEEKQNPKKEYKIEYSDNLTVEVGQNFNPRDYFTILDGETAIDKADVNLAIISGSTNTKGEIKYKITFYFCAISTCNRSCKCLIHLEGNLGIVLF